MPSDNIVDLKGRYKKSIKTEQNSTQAPVIDMTERRQEIIMDERRRMKRTILSSFIGAFCVVPRKGLVKVTLYDIAEAGLSFDMETSHGQFPIGEEVAMRVYLSQDSYFHFTAKVQNVRTVEGEDCYRHGGIFVKGSINDLALHHFVKFIENVSPSLQQDRGDHMATGSSGRGR
jgi:hypothetical protein